MLAGKDASRLLLVVAVGLLCWGCQNGPDHRPVARAQRRPAADPTPDEPTRPAAPLRITQPPAVAQDAPPAASPPAQPVALPALPALPPADAAGPRDAPAAPAEGDLRRLHRLADAEYARMEGYQVRLTRREQVNGKDQPKEIIRVSFRKEPWSVHFVWLEGEAKGREVVYVKGRYDDKIQTRLGAKETHFIYGPGSRPPPLAPDSPLVRGSTRHGVTEAGVGMLLDRFGALVAANEKGDQRRGTLTYRGPQKRPEFSDPVETVEQTIPAGADKDLPRGGRRLWMFDPANHMPALIVTTDDRGHEVEYYLYDRYIGPLHFEDRDFDPDKLWGKP
jgi:hypothetical protein